MNKLYLSFGQEKMADFLRVGIDNDADIKIFNSEYLPWIDGSISGIYAKNYISQLSQQQSLSFLLECRRVLAVGGFLIISIPDIDEVIRNYIKFEDKFEGGDILNRNFLDKKYFYNKKVIENITSLIGFDYGNLEIEKQNIYKRFGIMIDESNEINFIYFKRARISESNPLVSILIPSYHPEYFEIALKSAIAQSYQNIEILICDNDESGKIQKIIDPYLSNDKRIRYIKNDRNIGMIDNYIQCFNKARGDFIKYLNDDDILHPDCVEKLIKCFLMHPEVTLVTSRRQPIDYSGNSLPDIPATKCPFDQNYLVQGISLANAVAETGINFIGEPTTVMFRKSDLIDVRPNFAAFKGKNYLSVFDLGIWFNLLTKGEAVYLTDILSYFRLHHTQVQVTMDQEETQSELHQIRCDWLSISFNNKSSIVLVKPYHLTSMESGWQEYNLFGNNRSKNNLKLIAFYLPQFHPISENDKWWGKGFTDWRNVTKAKPLFEGHYQPHLPSDLGFYDLRLPKVLEEQADLARHYGIYGFCYYYYWFNGHRLLEKPIDDMLRLGKPDFPFCLCWANENWTRRWDGYENDILMAQTYDETDAYKIIRDLLPFFLDRRYIKINGKPLLLVYRTDIIPNVSNMISIWRQEVRVVGLPDLYLVRIESFYVCNPHDLGFDAACEFPPHVIYAPDLSSERVNFYSAFKGRLKDYKYYASAWINRSMPSYKLFRGIMPSWDNTARRGDNSSVFVNSSPSIYQDWLKTLVNYTLSTFDGDERLVFVNAWNEWAEGCHLEPDLKYGHAYLTATALALGKIVESQDTDLSAIKLNSPNIKLNFDYDAWRERHHWSASAVARLADQVMLMVEAGSGVHLLMVTTSNDNTAVADTIDTLAAQGSSGWRLTVISPYSCPDPLFETIPALAWVQLTTAEELPALLEQTVKFSAMDWFMVCAPGVRFEPVFASLALAASTQHPDWRCIYYDEERLDNEGHPTDPRLKPDINLELLRSSAYVGQAVLVHRALWPALDHRLAVWSRAFAFDAVLRALETDGESAIGHIDELAVALPKEADSQIEDWVSLARGLLEAHLGRMKEPAEVRPGLLPDTFFVDYSLTRRPLVSIIVPTKDRIDLLRPCLESLLEKTEYREFEVLVVDNGSTDPATLDYLKTVTRQDVRVKVLPYAAPYNFSAINNSAAEIAKGEFLVLLNNDTVVIQPNWLDRMLAHGLREGVGIVGCRLLFPNGRVQHAGVIIGMSGVADHVGIDAPMDAPGYLGRAQLVQNFSAVTAACLLIRRDLYRELGGLDEQRFPVLFNDVDLCLKARAHGLRVVWTPFATLVHHGSSSLMNNPDSRRLEDARRSTHELAYQWLPWQAADPAYNRHLSLLARDWSLDGIHDAPWNPNFEILPCILAIPHNNTSTSHYRLRDPLAALEDAACARHALLPNHDQFEPAFLEPSVLERTGAQVFLFHDALIFEWLETIRKILPHRRIVLSQNDAMAAIAARTTMSCAPKDAEVLEQAEQYLRQTLSFCDRLIVADQELADAFREMIEDIRIVPNYLPRWRWENLVSDRGRGIKPRVGWVGNVEQQGDLEFMLPVVEATRHEVDWVFVGACSENLQPLIAEFHPGVQFKDYPAQLAGLDLDLVVAPFEHSRFAASKNRLRLLEYGALGWPVICSDSGLYYPDAPLCRVPNHPQAWVEAIRERAHDRPATWEEGDRLQAWVRDHWMLEDHLEEWRQALLEGFSATPPVEPTIPTISKAAKPPPIDAKDSSAEKNDYQFHGAEESVDKQAFGPTVLPQEPHRFGTAMDAQLLISVIICSSDNERFARVARNYRDLLIDIPHEIIRIDDATSLCEGYNRGIARSRGDYLIFSHDDIQIWTPDFAQRLLRHLERCDLVGVVGTNLLVDTGGHSKQWKYTSWGAAGLGHVFGRIVQPQGEDYAVVVYGTPAVLIEGMQALDGVFIAARRQVVESLRFDEETFDGFHVYDLDFCYRAFQKGFHLGVFTDIAIVHESAGNYDEQYFNYHRRFLKKFEGALPKRRPYAWQHAFMVFQRAEEVLAFYQDAVEGMPAIATASNKAESEQRNAAESSDTNLYRRWIERRRVGEGWAEIVGERMVKRWQVRPTFHLVVWCEPGQQSALADTLESLGQQLYGQWGLSVLAPFDCPDGNFAELPNVEWTKVEANADAALRQALEESVLDWFALLEPGDRLASHALLKIADYINRYPTWRFIYLDEDQLDLRGERRDPVFRPGFDLDLLLATHYLGDFCLMHRETVLADGNLPYLPGVTTFQAALRVWERHGRSAIGHIADVLYHRTMARLPVADAGAVARVRQHLVVDHLARRGVAATVEATLLPGAWRMVYRHSRQPKVSIVVLAKDALDRLDRCLRKLLAKTAYPDYEVLVVDCGSEAEDTLDLYAELEERYPERFRVVAAQAPFSVSAYRNQGARQARGEVLIFLAGSALVVQDDWIERLLNHALRDDVGIVGARMTTPDAARPFVYGTAQLLGMRGLTGPMFAGLGLKAPGPLGRAQVDQTVSAVSAECLAIRREVLETLGGFDEAFTVSHADTDLCLRAAARGYRTVWTPFANLAWLGEYPLVAGAGHNHQELVEWARTDSERMFERWLPQLAADPAYNPNLSLAEPHRVEVGLAPGWDITFHGRPRVLGFPADETGCALYRIYAPLWLLEHQARAECTLVKSGTRPPELTELERLAPDTVFYQGMIADLGIAAMRQYRRSHNSFKVFDLDDLKHNVPDANSLKERLVRDIKYRHRQALQQCDRLIVSTEPLAEACRPWITDIRVVPNRLERARWGHLQNRRRSGPKPRVGWAGAQQHHGDLAFITDVVKQTHKEVDWVFFGMCLDEVRPYVKEVHGWVHLNDYPAKLASLDLDLAVAPLEQHPFNEAKSNLRILEHGILGRPMVCTDIYPYRDAPVKQVPNETGAWVDAIRERVHDLNAADREGDALRAWVLEHYILDDHTDDWLSALRP